MSENASDNDVVSEAQRVALARVDALVRDFCPNGEPGFDDRVPPAPGVEAEETTFTAQVEVQWRIKSYWRWTGVEPVSWFNQNIPTVPRDQLIERTKEVLAKRKPEALDAVGALARQENTPVLNEVQGSHELGGLRVQRRAEWPCGNCTGIGFGPAGKVRCNHCHGSGRARSAPHPNVSQGCTFCTGTGLRSCITCNGRGRVEQRAVGSWHVVTNATLTWGADRGHRQIKAFADALRVSDFFTRVPGARLVDAPDRNRKPAIRFESRAAVVFGRYWIEDSTFDFAFFKQSGKWLCRPCLLEPYALPLIEETESAARARDGDKLEPLADRWPAVQSLLEGHARAPGSLHDRLKNHADGLMNAASVQRLATALGKLQRRAAPRTRFLYWSAMIAGVVVLGVLFGPIVRNEAPSIGLYGAGLGLIGMYYLGSRLTRKRQAKVRESLRPPPIDGRLALITACSLAGAVMVPVYSEQPIPLRGPALEAIYELSDSAIDGGSYSDGGASDAVLSLEQSQRVLARLGHYDGAVDGLMGPNTRDAIRAFESDRDLVVDGSLSHTDHRKLLESWRVTEVQKALREAGYPIEAIDGTADAMLRQHVADHLGGSERGTDARVGPDTVHALGGQQKPPG